MESMKPTTHDARPAHTSGSGALRCPSDSCVGRFARMGSLGWARCYWCWWWEYGMYIPDGVNHQLCGDCMDLWEPPWYPNNRQRAELYLLAVWRTHPALRVVARSGVASYLADLVMP